MTQLLGIENDSKFLEETEANIMAYKAQRLVFFRLQLWNIFSFSNYIKIACAFVIIFK